ncbi:fibronectin type III domain-containing protein [Cellulophaga sp. Hel_I_12]|uniref:fibronectin type III domain-containing protein n=1 Tax=Cellulophaga sp. Hel_I_12 TaxID=1249972 RepID=UPI000AF8C27D|nr:fibronectin type III domain-containing protein [Cellulophaga sp. Hel_I_12]
MKYSIIILLVFTSFLKAQETRPTVQVLARSLPNKVLLRWAVDQPLAWKKANEYGFLIEKSTISRNGQAVIPIQKEQLIQSPLQPKPLRDWEALATRDQNAAVLAQALYGDTFETDAPSDALGKIYAINDELEQRFTFGLLAAEQNFEAAKLAAWAFEDINVIKGEQYVYKISVAVPLEDTLEITAGTVFAGPDLYEELPQPIGLAAVFGDGNVLLSWNFNLLQGLYTSYTIERSSDNQTYDPLNAVPLFNAQENDGQSEISLYYTDSIPNNTDFYYRIKGLTAFGETGPSTAPLSGKAEKSLGFVPRIYKKEIPTDDSAILYWEFDEKGNDLINGFEIRRANSDKGTYETVQNNIPITQRQVTIKNLKRVNYFTVVALGKNGVASESFATLVQPVDSIPPSPPTGLEAVLDTMGILKLSWTKNTEEDVAGYRIFKSNNPEVEFSEVTKTTFTGGTFVDTIPIKNLNEKVYFKLKAEDYRYNRSDFSEILIVDKPDVTPPSPPLFKNYKVTSEGVELQWINSTSTDVIAHILYRKNNTMSDRQWEEISVFTSIVDSIYVDKSIIAAGNYDYTMIAKDKVGLESTPTDPLSITWNGLNINEDAIKLSGTVNRELRFINLSWKIKDVSVVEYRLYRGTAANDLKLYKTFNGDTTSFNDTTLDINSDYWYGLQLVLSNGRISGIKGINLKY